MAPIAKDVETLTATTAAVPPTTAAAQNPQASAARPQPVPLEVPVSVNGARTVEGSDKREPFSESTKTVLVFANGAVIRLASSVAPGQLLFVTNEKSKKEVVCQVVKSKNYRTVTGYVELEFTEPAAGFWGVRIPVEQTAVPAVTPKVPVAAPVAARPTASTGIPGAAAPKAPTATPIAPVATKATVPVAPVNTPPVTPPSPPAAIPVSAKPEVAISNPLQEKAPETPKPEIKLPTIAEFLEASPVAQPRPTPVKAESLPAQQLSTLASTDLTPATEVKLQPPAASTLSPAPKTNDATTDELRQQAARLQEQLGSLLFREETAEKKKEQVVSGIPVAPLPELAASPKPAAEIPVATPAATQKEIPVEPAITEVKPGVASIPVAETKPIISAVKSSQFNLKVEEVKIPSWLAPLARESESESQATATAEISESTGLQSDAQASAGDYSILGTEEKSATLQTVVFGGQLLGGATATEQPAESSGSKKGLILGLAAAAALVIGGGVWFGLQPGNFLAGKAPAAQTIAASNLSESTSAPNRAPVIAPSSAPVSSAAPAAANSRPLPVQPANAASVEANKVSNAAATPVRPAPVVEQPKKPSLGDVHLVTPNVNHSETSAANEAAPSIDSTNAAGASDPLTGIAAGSPAQPAAPLVVGGDVKPAQLLKSVPPVYPGTARTQRVAGDVKLDALIDANGNVTTTKVLSGPVLLHQAAATAVKQWKYQPAMLDGKPTAMHLTVTVQFRLQ